MEMPNDTLKSFNRISNLTSHFPPPKHSINLTVDTTAAVNVNSSCGLLPLLNSVENPVENSVVANETVAFDAATGVFAAAATAAVGYQYYRFVQRNHLLFFVPIVGAALKIQSFAKSKGMVSDEFLKMMQIGDGPHRPCIQFINGNQREIISFSFQQINDLANRVASWAFSDLKLKRGDVVALIMSNRPEFVAIWLGLSKLGVVTALINNNLRSKGLQHCITIASSKIIIVGDDQIDELFEDVNGIAPVFSFGINNTSNNNNNNNSVKNLVDILNSPAHINAKEPPPETRIGHVSTNPMIYIYTSGTTGLPKAAIISHLRYMLMSTMSGTVGLTNKDVLYSCLPLYHSAAGVIGVGSLFHLGNKIVIVKKFSASSFWEDCIESKATAIQYIGELFRYLIAQPPRPSEKKHGVKIAIGNGLRPDIWQTVVNRFGDIRVCEFYGSTEGNVGLVNGGFKLGAVGFMPPIIDRVNPCQIIKFDTENETPIRNEKTGYCTVVPPGEAGELISKIAGDLATRFDGYVGAKGNTEKKILHDVFVKGDAYFRSGDLLKRDEDGYYYFVDRIGDTFRWKGENVSTNEVAEAINIFPNVQECNVYGVAVGASSDGKAGMANIVLLDSKIPFDFEKFFAHIQQQLPSYARPVFLRFSTAVEVTGTFKHRKVELAKEAYHLDKVNNDAIYLIQPDQKTFVRLTEEIYNTISSIKF